ncbi:2Fe-2S iron-sulfur cluster-binding protein [Martelella soudanensis]|uniref:2Fe-2S iron-sulfur cluster-binding protein n=1 Tax=unclassified Martelella TaxID=2629616 RepID=UPI0015DEDF81|nr:MULTISPECIES: 2Fe-2S iron-sulfur cluster-binding protein [unclassified Martelella]
MSQGSFFFMGREIFFRPGETIAAALAAEGVMQFGVDGLGQPTRYFCGIGACQCCIARVDGIVRETCLTPARDGMQVESMEGGYV